MDRERTQARGKRVVASVVGDAQRALQREREAGTDPYRVRGDDDLVHRGAQSAAAFGYMSPMKALSRSERWVLLFVPSPFSKSWAGKVYSMMESAS